MSDNIGKISVIIPVYNAEKYLEKCVNSLLKQTYGDLEIILIDDGSKDGSGALMDGYAEKDERVTVVHKENGGVSSARNLGLQKARGEYIAFIDADDYVANDYFEVLYSEALSSGADIVCCDCEWIVDGKKYDEVKMVSKRRIVTEKSDYYFDVATQDEFYNRVVWGKIIKAEFAKKFSFEKDIKYGEDTLYMFNILSLSPKCLLTEYVGYYYIQNTNGAMLVAGDCNPLVKIQQLASYRYLFLTCDDVTEKARAAIIDLYAHMILGAVVVCFRQKTKECYKKYKPQLLSCANEVKPYKKYVQRYFRMSLTFFRKTPGLCRIAYCLFKR